LNRFEADVENNPDQGREADDQEKQFKHEG
jgi:hypothetical protein